MTLERALMSVGLLIAVAAAVGCDDETSSWEETPIDGLDQYYSSVWGAANGEVFVVGGVRAGLIYHFDGESWELANIPANTPALIWVFGFGPDDVFAVGERGAFLHYDGTGWQHLDSNTSKTLWGTWGRSANDLWMVGGDIGQGRPTIRHWNGQESEVYEIDPSEYDMEDVHALFKVWGAEDDVFVVGQRGTMLNLVDDDWKRIDLSPATDMDLISVWGNTAEDVVAVGGRGNGIVVVRDGDDFEVRETELGGVSAVVRCGDDIWLGTDSGLVASYDAVTDEATIDYSTFNTVHALWSDCRGTVHAVGGFFQQPPTMAVSAMLRP